MFELPADHADVSTMALMMEGTTLIFALFAAMTNGDCAAVPVDLSSCGSFEGTTRPTTQELSAIDYMSDLFKLTHEDGEHVKNQNSPEDSLGGLRNGLSRILGLCSSDDNGMNSSIRIQRAVKRGPEAHEPAQGSWVTEVLDEGTWVFPREDEHLDQRLLYFIDLPETKADGTFSSSATGYDQGKNVDENDQQNLQK